VTFANSLAIYKKSVSETTFTRVMKYNYKSSQQCIEWDLAILVFDKTVLFQLQRPHDFKPKNTYEAKQQIA